MIELKQPEQLQIMGVGGQKLAACLAQVVAAAKVGVTTLELDSLAERLILEVGGRPNFKGYQGYPYTLCTSVNEQVIHGFPNKRALVSGDVLTIDVGMLYQGWHVDHAVTVVVGLAKEVEQQQQTQRFLKTGQRALAAAIDQIKPGAHVGDLSAAIQAVVEEAGYSVIRDFTGHGLGSALHMEPIIPCFGRAGTGARLEVGMTLAVEVMMNMGKAETRTLKDGWTVVSKDKSLSAQFEHTVAVTQDGFEILTQC